MAREIGADPMLVIAATPHGKRAIDNLATTRFNKPPPPHLTSPHELSSISVDDFERSSAFFCADAHWHGRGHAAHNNSSTPSLLSSGTGTGTGSIATARSSFVLSLLPSGAAASTERLFFREPHHPWRVADESELEGEAAAEEDRAVRRILPGVKPLLESIPEGRYAMYTSGTKKYGTITLQFPLFLSFLILSTGGGFFFFGRVTVVDGRKWLSFFE